MGIVKRWDAFFFGLACTLAGSGVLFGLYTSFFLDDITDSVVVAEKNRRRCTVSTVSVVTTCYGESEENCKGTSFRVEATLDLGDGVTISDDVPFIKEVECKDGEDPVPCFGKHYKIEEGGKVKCFYDLVSEEGVLRPERLVPKDNRLKYSLMFVLSLLLWGPCCIIFGILMLKASIFGDGDGWLRQVRCDAPMKEFRDMEKQNEHITSQYRTTDPHHPLRDPAPITSDSSSTMDLLGIHRSSANQKND